MHRRKSFLFRLFALLFALLLLIDQTFLTLLIYPKCLTSVYLLLK